MINCVSNVGTSFKANATNENGQKYYKSNKGTIAGAIMAIPAVYINIKPAFLNVDKLASAMDQNYSKIIEFYKNLGLSEKDIEAMIPKNYKELMTRSKQFAIPCALIAGACTLGAGVLFDKIRNKKASAAAKDLETGDYNGIYANGGAVDFSKTGVPYYKSTNGVKYGFLTGMTCGAINSVMNCAKNKKFDGKTSLLNVILLGLGGVIMGSIAQKASNKAAEKSTYA